MTGSQRQDGRFYTEANPFRHKAFKAWAKRAGLPAATVLEPFAGSNRLVEHLMSMGLCGGFCSYDIEPGSLEVIRRDTLADFPAGFDVCVTNPPWLARNVATRLGMRFPDCAYQDIYAFALERCLERCGWVAALVPESFLRTGLFRERLGGFVSLTRQMFSDTDHPVGLALFEPHGTEGTAVWSGHRRIGRLEEIESGRPAALPGGPKVRFNDPDGNVGLLALDNVWKASIRFCRTEELGGYQVRVSCRSITRIKADCRIDIERWNESLNRFRADTDDVLMTPYRGLRRDGKYRRRCDWSLARGVIHRCAAGAGA